VRLNSTRILWRGLREPGVKRRKGYRYLPGGHQLYPYKVRRRQVISDEALSKARGYLPDEYYKLLEKIAKGPPGVYPLI